MLYLPAGFWHKVEATEEGSLSINFSIDGSRWIDLLTNRLLPQLWSDPRWRERPDMSMGPDSARKHRKTLLSSLTNVIQSMQTDQLLPDGMFLDSRRWS